MINKYTVYCDGSSLGNPGRTGCAFVVLDESDNIVHSEAHFISDMSTNNYAELSAFALAMTWARDNNAHIDVYSDAQYVVKGGTEWIYGWRKKQFSGVKNRDLWLLVDDLINEVSFTCTWVKGHSNDKWNDHVDKLAKDAASS